ncbi:MAG: type II secretion system protein [Pseudomonadota bacterium]|nr:type II secretion system protein [Pseudomonadota bacterium]
MPKLQKGFTMIELVMVIVILGILAAVALPRFYDLQKDARLSKGQALLGSVRSASAITHSAALVQNLTGGTVAMEGVNITLINAYPTANAAGIIAAANITAATDAVTISAGGAAAGSVITVQVTGATNPALCQVSYTAPAAGAAPAITFNGTRANC